MIKQKFLYTILLLVQMAEKYFKKAKFIESFINFFYVCKNL